MKLKLDNGKTGFNVKKTSGNMKTPCISSLMCSLTSVVALLMLSAITVIPAARAVLSAIFIRRIVSSDMDSTGDLDTLPDACWETDYGISTLVLRIIALVTVLYIAGFVLFLVG
jgi:hypothetical protein